MKLEIWNEPKNEEEPIRLRLVRYGNDIRLSVVDKNGDVINDGNLLTIYGDLVIVKSRLVNEKLGFKLDSEGRVIVE